MGPLPPDIIQCMSYFAPLFRLGYGLMLRCC